MRSALPNYTTALRRTRFAQLYSVILTVLFFYVTATFRAYLREHREYFVIRVNEAGEAYVSNPIDWWEYQRPREKEAVAVAGTVAQLLLDATSDAFDKQFDFLRKRGLLARNIVRDFEARWAARRKVKTPEGGEVEMTAFEIQKKAGLVCEVEALRDRFTAEESRDGVWTVRIVLRRHCRGPGGEDLPEETFLARATLHPTAKRTYLNPHGLVVTDIDFTTVSSDYDPRGKKEGAS